MCAKLEIGEYREIDLEDWIKQVDSRFDWLTQHLADVEDAIKRIKKMVPLCDDELGMHEVNELSEEGRDINGN